MNDMQKLQERLKGNTRGNATDMIRIRHVMMKTYGWISLDEFRKLGINELSDLMEQIETDYKIERGIINKAKHKSK